MRKVLLGSTALLGFGLMSASALAQVELAITGSVDVNGGFVSEDNDDDRNNFGITTDTTLNFNASGVADNGLEYGGRINVDDNADTEFAIDETWIYVGGDFGEVRLGEKEGQASNLRFTIPTVGNGQSDGDWSRYVNGGGNIGTDFVDSGDAARVSFIGDFAGFTVGASYAPNSDQEKSDPGLDEGDDDLENMVSLGANYKGDFGAVAFGVSAGYAMADANTGDDLDEYGVGAELGFGAATVGGFFINSDGGGVDDRDRYGLGASYTFGAWGVAANALWQETDDDTNEAYGVGVEYGLAPGLTPYADVVFFDDETADNDGTVFLVGVTAAF